MYLIQNISSGQSRFIGQIYYCFKKNNHLIQQHLILIIDILIQINLKLLLIS